MRNPFYIKVNAGDGELAQWLWGKLFLNLDLVDSTHSVAQSYLYTSFQKISYCLMASMENSYACGTHPCRQANLLNDTKLEIDKSKH